MTSAFVTTWLSPTSILCSILQRKRDLRHRDYTLDVKLLSRSVYGFPHYRNTLGWRYDEQTNLPIVSAPALEAD